MQVRSFIRRTKNEPRGVQIIQFRLTALEFKHIQTNAKLQTGRVLIEQPNGSLVIKLSDASNLGIPAKPGFDEERNRYEQISYRPSNPVNIPLTPWQSVTPTLTKHLGVNVITFHLSQLRQTFPRFYHRKQEPLYRPEEHKPGPVRKIAHSAEGEAASAGGSGVGISNQKPTNPDLTQQIQSLVEVLNNLAKLAHVRFDTDPKTGKLRAKKEGGEQ